MNTPDSTLSLDDLAAQFTDPALEMLTAAGIRPVSVDLEVEIWHTLKRVLRHIMGKDMSPWTDPVRRTNAGFTGHAGEFVGAVAGCR